MIEIVPNWHPVFVHFTVGLLLVSVAVGVLAALLPAAMAWRERLLGFAHGNLRLGYLFALATAYFGWLAFNSVDHDDLAHRVMTEHRDFALLTLALFAPFFLLSWFRQKIGRRLTLILALAMVVPGVSLARTGWLGGELVFRHGLGVQRLPRSENVPPAAPAAGAAQVETPPPASDHPHQHNHRH